MIKNNEPNIKKKVTKKDLELLLHRCFTEMMNSVREKRATDFVRLRELFGDKFNTEGMAEYNRHRELIDENFSKVSDNYLDGEKKNED